MAGTFPSTHPCGQPKGVEELSKQNVECVHRNPVYALDTDDRVGEGGVDTHARRVDKSASSVGG